MLVIDQIISAMKWNVFLSGISGSRLWTELGLDIGRWVVTRVGRTRKNRLALVAMPISPDHFAKHLEHNL